MYVGNDYQKCAALLSNFRTHAREKEKMDTWSSFATFFPRMAEFSSELSKTSREARRIKRYKQEI